MPRLRERIFDERDVRLIRFRNVEFPCGTSSQPSGGRIASSSLSFLALLEARTIFISPVLISANR